MAFHFAFLQSGTFVDILIFVAEENKLSQKAGHFQVQYPSHILSEIQSEGLFLKVISDMNFKLDVMSLKKEYDQITNLRFDSVFPYIIITLSIFLSFCVASNEEC